MKLSYVIVTHNRREPLLRTLEILQRTTPLPPNLWEAWVVDNASTDGTIEAVRQQFPWVNIIARPGNEGVWSRSYAFEPARGTYLILLDDDSYPTGDAVSLSIDYLDRTPHCAAVVGKVVLPDGSLEACAMPAVMLSGAVCLRKSVLASVGGFRREFFRKAGEYDFSFRIWQKGFTVERFEDVVYRHDKVMTGRSAAFAHRMDLRNNLILVERYIPREHRRAYWDDYLQRYTAVARAAGCGRAATRALWEARLWAIREAVVGRQTLDGKSFETIFEHHRQAGLVMHAAREHRLNRVVIADFSKTLYATWQACRRANLSVAAIADSGDAFANLTYRDTPVLPVPQALALRDIDGVIVSNVNPAQIDARIADIRRHFSGPVVRLWEPRFIKPASARAAA